MKVYVTKTSDEWGTGKVQEYSDLHECITTLLETEDFGRWEPEIIVSKADDMTEEQCGEKCEYEIELYDDYRE